jgi:hypothetical protein
LDIKKELITRNLATYGEESGGASSDSCPSEDNLDYKDMKKLL